MLAIYPLPAETPRAETPPERATVMLCSGKTASLAGLSHDQLHQLQWEQEQKFARAIMAFPARSAERSLIVGQAYDTISTILVHIAQEKARAQGDSADAQAPLLMGFDQKYVRLVLRLLNNQVARGEGRPRMFEIGYGSGVLLKEVRDYGFDVSGIEVSAAMHERAVRVLGPRYAAGLMVGDFRSLSAEDLPGPPTLVYWNDVLEHVAVDEAEDYLAHIHRLLAPRGQLVTITPNWLLRPSDVTGDFCPARTQARGLHLKEYRLAEVTRMLRRAGFRRVATPLATTRKHVMLLGGGGRRTKQLLEPLLDRAPLALARLLCRGWSMSCTIATK
ncbi:MAG TPA: class I SAM-dependent methyltransferase [Lacipirellulaceae bacterium]|nr:class I SAM-dependent methyltransferase [Lacipirellulaceae bacterium]